MSEKEDLINYGVVYALQHTVLWVFGWSELSYVGLHRSKSRQNDPQSSDGQTVGTNSKPLHRWLTGGLQFITAIAAFLAAYRMVYDSKGPVRSIIEAISMLTVFGLQMYSTRHRVDHVFLFSFWAVRLLALSMELSDWWNTYDVFQITLALLWLATCSVLAVKSCSVHHDTQPEPNLIRKLYFSWLDPMYREAQRSDSPFHTGALHNQLPDDRRCRVLLKWFRRRAPKRQYAALSETDEGADRGLTIGQLLDPFRRDIRIAGINRCVLVCTFFLCPYLLNVLLEPNQSVRIQKWVVAGMFYTSIGIAILNTQYQHATRDIGLRIKSILMGMIYESMTDKVPPKVSSTVLTNDTGAFITLMLDLHMMWSGPLIIACTIGALWLVIGPSALVGVVQMAVMIACTKWLSKKLASLQQEMKRCQDDRVRLTTEAIEHAQQIKAEQLESCFEQRIDEHRTKELRCTLRSIWFEATKQLLSIVTPILVAFETFVFMELVGSGSRLTVRSMFVAISLFNITRYPMTMIPTLFTSWNNAKVSLERINVFIRAGLHGIESETVVEPADSSQERFRMVSQQITTLISTQVLKLESANFAIGDKQILHNITLTVLRGSFTAVYGTHGAGKTCLLRAILGAIPQTAGKRMVAPGNFSYCAQTPWIQNDTIRNNILFGQPYDQPRYEAIISACCLEKDFRTFPDGDERVIGEGSLSGGQAQRVSLARAIYHEANVYLFDDPLRSLDSNISRKVFQRVFNRKTGVLADKTIIFVSHSLEHLRAADTIVTVTEGHSKILETREFVQHYEQEDAVQSTNDSKGSLERNKTLHKLLKQQTKLRKHAEKRSEHNVQGTVPLKIYREFVRLLGWCWSGVIIILEASVTVLDIYVTVLLAEWASTERTSEESDRKSIATIWFVALILTVWSILLFVKTGMLHARGRSVGKDVHRRMLSTVLRQPMEFYDTTDSGVIVNRFSNDLNILDSWIIVNLRSVLSTLCSVLGTLGLFVYKLSSVYILYTFVTLAAVVMLMCGLCYLLSYHLRVARTLKRFEASSRSPIVLQYNETVQGIDTIKAYGAEGRFQEQFVEKVDRHQSYAYQNLAANRWIGIRLEFVGVLVIYLVMLGTVTVQSEVGLAFVGIIVTHVLRLIPSLNALLVAVGQFVENVISVERLLQYLDLPCEPLDEGLPVAASGGFPRGSIEYRHFSLTHADESKVLDDINLSIRAGEKLGIIGRTGAGKSSLIGALFRFYPRHTSGAILLDGYELDRISLKSLRSSLTLVPQSTALFTGLVQSFVDPQARNSSETIISTLDRCGLRHIALGAALEQLSVGERQLLCLARGLLRDTPIIVLDEATSAVDTAAEASILQVIREHFHDRTVLMIAHRLHTVQNCDRIVWIEDGRIKKLAVPGDYTDGDWSALQSGE
ncbi:ABC transporter C family member 8-like [Anopheles bellator]|uniref:ABC transporter C family member 8-like n=1 Tax=Anopheles bellator TaxID=139047 RepID=UPI002649B3EB|nr:ABC transporter C family member 8-like [Anopheles bellator]